MAEFPARQFPDGKDTTHPSSLNLNECFEVGKSQNNPENILLFLQQHPDDPAVQVRLSAFQQACCSFLILSNIALSTMPQSPSPAACLGALVIRD